MRRREYTDLVCVSTHSRLKAAGRQQLAPLLLDLVSTHSRLKAAGALIVQVTALLVVSTHSRLKAAGWETESRRPRPACFNTQPPEGGWFRRLLRLPWPAVSTHSRLKAAGSKVIYCFKQ